MHSVDLEVLRQTVSWLDQGLPVTLVTVVKTFGSSPRPPGAMLAVCSDGRLAGSVSGGCIEDDLIERLRRGEDVKPTPEVVTYGVSSEEARRFGLPCGAEDALEDTTWLRDEARALLFAAMRLEHGGWPGEALANRVSPVGSQRERERSVVRRVHRGAEVAERLDVELHLVADPRTSVGADGRTDLTRGAGQKNERRWRGGDEAVDAAGAELGADRRDLRPHRA